MSVDNTSSALEGQAGIDRDIAADAHGVPFGEAVRVWARVAVLSFGGPAGQIAVMHRILVEEKRWIGETRFLHALNYCMLLPGPEAHQLAIYIGWLLHRTRGGLVAGTLFVLPGLVCLGLLSWIYAAYGGVGLVQGLFFGLKAAVLAIVVDAVVRVGRRALKTRAMVALAGLAFLGIFAFELPFPLIIAAAAAVGLAASRLRPDWFRTGGGHGPAGTAGKGPAAVDAAFAHGAPAHVRPSLSRLVQVTIIGLAVWLGPLVLLSAALGAGNVYTSIAAFNSKMAVVTFGGAYAVLAYMAQQSVETYHWLKPDEMLVGLGFAETSPGPLISVVQFVGFMAAFRNPGPLDPMLAGTLGGLLANWSTFVPSFLWIFMGAPYIEALRGNKTLGAALTAIAAAVVGVILNLSIWLALHTLFGTVTDRQVLGMVLPVPDLASIDLPALLLAAAAMVAIFPCKAGMIPTLAGCSLAGIVLALAGFS